MSDEEAFMNVTRRDRRFDQLIVDRLWARYAWPEQDLPMRLMTVARLFTYKSQPAYVSDEVRTRKQPRRAWDYGRIRFFYEELLAGVVLDAIEVVADYGHLYPEPILLDGHHRLAAAHLAGLRCIRALYSGRIDLLRYLTGSRKTCPVN